MDDSKSFIELLWKHLFWVLCGLVLIFTPLSWFIATDSLVDAYGETKNKIVSSFTSIENLGGPASDQWYPELDKEIDELRKSVYTAHKENYDRQVKDLTWPQPPNVSQSFAEAISKYKPGDVLPDDARESYRDYIAKEIPKLEKLLEARPEEEAGAGQVSAYPGAVGGAAAGPLKLTGKVVWDSVDKLAFKALLDPWQGATVPSTSEIMLTQEDLWVYQKVFLTIAAVNKEATSRFNAAIKTVAKVEVGSAATQFLSQGQGSSIVIAQEQGGGGMDAYAKMAAGGPDSGYGGLSGNSFASRRKNRYLSGDKQPLADPNEANALPLKLIPIHLTLVVDQRQIPKLIAECGNAAIEVISMKIQCGSSDAAASPGGGSGGSGGYPGRSGYPGGGGGGYPGPRAEWIPLIEPQPRYHFVGPFREPMQLAQAYPGGGKSGYPGGGGGGYGGFGGASGGGSPDLLINDPEIDQNLDVVLDMVGVIYFYNKPVSLEEAAAAPVDGGAAEQPAAADEAADSSAPDNSVAG